MGAQDQALLTLKEPQIERQSGEFLKSLYEAEPVEYNGSNFDLAKACVITQNRTPNHISLEQEITRYPNTKSRINRTV